ncbi:MAG: SURF1 family protein [Acidimicrobiales bacterium]
MSYRWALEPKWLLSHLFVVGLVVAMLAAGFWQLRRHQERADRNALIEQRADRDAVPLETALASSDDPGQLQYVRVTVSGAYREQDSVLVANRTRAGAPGFWVMSPLEMAGGSEVWVARGFVGRGTVADMGAEVFDAPDGTLEVSGLIQPSASGGALAQGDGVPEVNRPDVAVLAEWAGTDNTGVYIQAQSDPSTLFFPIDLPPLDSGPHRGYAAQWFIFSMIAIVGYPLILRRAARERAGTLTADATSV